MLNHLLNVQEKPVRLLQRFLHLIQVPVTGTTIEQVLLNHPDYPSLLSLSDALRGWHINNIATQVSKEDIRKLPLPFIAHTNRGHAEAFVVVTEINEAAVKIITGEGKEETAAFPQFINGWSGITLLAEKTAQSGETRYAANRRKERIGLLKIPSLFLTALLLIAASFLSFSPLLSAADATGYFLLLFCMLCGIGVTSLLLWYEIDKANPALQKICTAGAKTNCNAILGSKQANVFTGFSWSEAGFFYFTTGYVSLLVAGFETSFSLLYVVVLLTAAALPYTLFSVYYQWKIAKQWCPLCVAVQVLLAAGFATALSTGLLGEAVIALPRFSSILWFALISAFVATGWYSIKLLLLQGEEGKRNRRELARLKANPQIWNALLSKQKQIITPADGLGITIGNPQAANTLVKVCNPYCGPCAKTHPEIEKLVKENENLKVQIIFTATSDEADKRSLPVKHLLAIANGKNEAVTKKALDDWYLADKKDYDLFADKYPMNGELKRQDAKVEAMQAWCKDANIMFTPTFFINGHQLPDIYSLRDIKNFLS